MAVFAHNWQRDARNPIFSLGETFDSFRCMNPFVIPQGDEYFLFYGGADKAEKHQICLAIAAKNDLTKWRRLGPIFESGKPGAFDEKWCVLPNLHQFGDLWHLYYTGNNGGDDGLQAFRGIGLATSRDLIRWERWGDEPVLKGDGFDEWPENKGVAGGGSIVEVEENGETLYRMYYTLATGRPDPDLKKNQAKFSVVVHSRDGFTWFDKQVLLRPREEALYEDVAVTGLSVWREGDLWRGIYPAIGTKFRAYSICEAISRDGLNWERGEPGENLALERSGDGWESRMVEYPFVAQENGRLRLFYCGNGVGATGIGTATAEELG